MLSAKSFYFWFLLLLLLIILLLLPLTIRISINNLRKANSVSFELFILLSKRFQLFAYKKALFSLNKNEGTHVISFFRSLLGGKQSWKEPREIRTIKRLLFIYRLISSFGCERLDLYIKLGTGDPSLTGIITGFLRSFFGIISLLIANNLGVRQRPGFFVYPSFFQKELRFFFRAEFGLNGLRIMHYLMQLFWEIAVAMNLKKLWRCLKYGRTSYSGFNDYGDGKLKRDG